MDIHIRKQRVIFVNLHYNVMFVRTLDNLLLKRSSARKHQYLLDELMGNPTIEVCSYINRNGFSIGSSFNKSIQTFLRMFRFMEYNYVMRKNGLDSKKITKIHSAKEIRSDDIILLYIKYPRQFDRLNEIRAFKAVCLIHLSPNYPEISALLRTNRPNLLLSESNYFKFNPLFKKEFNWFDESKLFLFPFVYEDRFQPLTPFGQRKNIAVSVGTITTYKGEVIQPGRRQIKDNADKLKDYIACYNEYYNEDKNVKEVLPTDNFITRIRKKLYYATHSGLQTRYFSFDMVAKFNEYKMCIIGEEITGVPGIGFVEGMACGCAYIGLNKGLYEQYGLKEGVHYIGYDGTLPDLTEKIRYWQCPENQDRLEEIAQTGCAYVREHFNKKAVATQLLSHIIEEYKAWNRSKNDA